MRGAGIPGTLRTNFNVAISLAVVKKRAPARGVRNRTTASTPLSKLRTKTLLYDPAEHVSLDYAQNARDIPSPSFLNEAQHLAPTAAQATCCISSMSNSTYRNAVSNISSNRGNHSRSSSPTSVFKGVHLLIVN